MRQQEKTEKTSGKLVASDMLSAWQSITYDPDFIIALLAESEAEKKHATASRQETPVASTQDEDDGFETINMDELETPCPLSDRTTIKLAEHLEQRFEGLPEGVCSALKTARKEIDETDLDFAKRRLLAVLPSLITTENPTLSTFANQLNKWHKDLYHRHKNDFEQVLAGTVFYFDRTNHRLVIRHTPFEVDEEIKADQALLLQQRVTDQIIAHLNLTTSDRNKLYVQHIVPCIANGTFSLHSILRIRSEHQSEIAEVTFDPATSIMSKIKSNPQYQYLDVQALTNNNDCGRHVTVMTVIAFRLLISAADKSASTITRDDFLQYSAVTSAKDCPDAHALKALITSMRPDTALPVRRTPPKRNTSGWDLFGMFATPSSSRVTSENSSPTTGGSPTSCHS